MVSGNMDFEPTWILIADSDQNTREILEKTIGGTSDFQLIFAVDGRQTLKMADTYFPEIVILGMNMAVPSGLEICRRLKETTRPQFPRFTWIILLTGMGNDKAIEEGLHAGITVDAVIPFRPETLLRHLQDRRQISSLKRGSARNIN